jgi:hypothetical protein
MPSLDARLKELETKMTPPMSLNVVFIHPKEGESNRAAIIREGHDPDAENTKYICFVGMDWDEVPD